MEYDEELKRSHEEFYCMFPKESTLETETAIWV